jgi:hypothetical protein
MPSEVVWYEKSLDPDRRSHYAISTLLNDAFDTVGDFVHRSTFAELPEGIKQAVVVIHAGHDLGHIDDIQNHLNQLDRSLVILIGDEGAQFPAQRLMATNRRIWVQMPVPGKHDFASHYLICGHPHDAPPILAKLAAKEKVLNWFYSGQVQNARRRQCVDQLQKMGGGVLNTTPGFWQGYEHEQYYALMAQAKIIPCPAGSCTPDTIRVAEAIEAGCVPIVDGHFPFANYPGNYWKYTLQRDPPFPVIYDWSNLPQVIADELAKWPANRDAIQVWWAAYKTRLAQWLKEDSTW